MTPRLKVAAALVAFAWLSGLVAIAWALAGRRNRFFRTWYPLGNPGFRLMSLRTQWLWAVGVAPLSTLIVLLVAGPEAFAWWRSPCRTLLPAAALSRSLGSQLQPQGFEWEGATCSATFGDGSGRRVKIDVGPGALGGRLERLTEQQAAIFPSPAGPAEEFAAFQARENTDRAERKLDESLDQDLGAKAAAEIRHMEAEQGGPPVGETRVFSEIDGARCDERARLRFDDRVGQGQLLELAREVDLGSLCQPRQQLQAFPE